MKNKFLKIIVFVFLFVSGFSWAQFNTLTPIQPQKSESQKFFETNKEDIETKQSHEKKSWKSIFNSDTKAKLKNETEGSAKWLTSQIDSLKILLKTQQINHQKKEQKRKTDSLISRIKELEIVQKKLQKQEDFKNQFEQSKYEKADFETFRSSPLNSKIEITSPFGTRTHPIFGTKKSHNGIDLKANYENVYSVLDGIVTASGWDSKGGGNFIKINHYNRFETSYLHLSEIYYQVGEKVKAGFIIAKSGNTGNSTGPHLHFGVKEFGQNINPIHFLNDLNKAKQLITNHYEH